MSIRVLFIFICLVLTGGLVGCAPGAPSASPSQGDDPCDVSGAMWHRVGDDNPWVDEHEVAWSRYEVLGERCLRVHFTTGSGAAFAHRYVLSEDDERIVVKVIEGTIPDAPESWWKDHEEIAMLVRTDRPVGSREVVGGN